MYIFITIEPPLKIHKNQTIVRLLDLYNNLFATKYIVIEAILWILEAPNFLR